MYSFCAPGAFQNLRGGGAFGTHQPIFRRGAKKPLGRNGRLTIDVVDREVSLVFRSCTYVSDVLPGDGLVEENKVYGLPPGAVGCAYGSGCFQFSRSFSVSFSSACPVCQLNGNHCILTRAGPDPLLPRVRDIAVLLK